MGTLGKGGGGGGQEIGFRDVQYFDCEVLANNLCMAILMININFSCNQLHGFVIYTTFQPETLALIMI